jgi:hypothetical protein
MFNFFSTLQNLAHPTSTQTNIPEVYHPKESETLLVHSIYFSLTLKHMALHMCLFYQLRMDAGREHFQFLQTTHLTSNVDQAEIIYRKIISDMVSVVADLLLGNCHFLISKLIALIRLDFVN